jgi:hypothetical protein
MLVAQDTGTDVKQKTARRKSSSRMCQVMQLSEQSGKFPHPSKPKPPKTPPAKRIIQSEFISVKSMNPTAATVSAAPSHQNRRRGPSHSRRR